MIEADDVTQVVYVVAHENGDDMCGGLNLHGIFTSEGAAEDCREKVVAEGFLGVTVYACPLNTPGWLGYMSDRFER